MKPTTSKKEIILLLSILFFALFLRVWITLHHPIPAGDGIASNVEMSVHINEGNGFSTLRKWTLYDNSKDPIRPEANRQPFLSILLSLLFRIIGGSPGYLPAQVLMNLIGLVTLVVFWLMVRNLFGTTPAILSTLLLAINPLFLWFSTQTDSLLIYCIFAFLAVLIGNREKLETKHTVLLGFIAGMAYLTRTQGMLLAFSLAVWVFFRSEHKKIRQTVLFLIVFALICTPWFLRNIFLFGSPTYSQNTQFLLNENHWAAWEIRDTAPSPLDLFHHQGSVAVGQHIAAGFLRTLEPFFPGTMHRSEPFAGPSLILFIFLSFFMLSDRKQRNRFLLPVIITLPVMAVLVLHDHSHRYLAFPIALVIAAGCAGLIETEFWKNRKKLFRTSAVLFLLLPFYRPVMSMLSDDSRARANEAREITDWISRNTEPGEWVVTFPNVELFIWLYNRPTLTMPNDFEMLLWPCLEDHDVRYVIIDLDLPVLRPHLSERWRRSPDGESWVIINPPPFLTEVYRSESEQTIVYRWNGTVPDGFMFVDSLPPDNYRALSPGF